MQHRLQLLHSAVPRLRCTDVALPCGKRCIRAEAGKQEGSIQTCAQVLNPKSARTRARRSTRRSSMVRP